MEAALLGLASLALTLANILCIVLTGIAILRQAFARFIYSKEEKSSGYFLQNIEKKTKGIYI